MEKIGDITAHQLEPHGICAQSKISAFPAMKVIGEDG
jgi:hypothetical protein